MEKNRRGFISTAAGVGVFSLGTSSLSRAEVLDIGDQDLLVAMPDDRYYAIPGTVLAQYAVKAQTFAAEEERRRASSRSEVRMRGNDVPLGVRG